MFKISARCPRMFIRTFCARTVNDSTYSDVKIKNSSIAHDFTQFSDHYLLRSFHHNAGNVPRMFFFPIIDMDFLERIVTMESAINSDDLEEFIPLIDSNDITRHANLASEWWKPKGPMIALHSLNQIRVPFIRDGLISVGAVLNEHKNTSTSLQGLHLLEVGCGAGILTEQLARIHAKMTSIDPGSDVIDVAREHVLGNRDLASRITYRNESIELHCIENKSKYDAVIISEVLEHVNNKSQFLENCLDTVKPGGSIFITTFNKTLLSWFGAIVIAENLTTLVPRGTHDWEQFISPIDVQRTLDQLNCSTVLVNGFLYEFWRDTWKWTRSTNISYALHAVKNK